MEILEVETLLCDEKWHEKKVGKRKLFFSLRENETKKKVLCLEEVMSFFAQKKGKFSTMKKMKEMRRRGCGIWKYFCA